MPLPFSLVCELLEESHKLCLARKPNKSAVRNWFTRNRTRIDAHDTNLVALLSTLLPDKRSDRVYCIQSSTLELIIGRGLSLGASRKLELARHREPGSGVDLAGCVERILSITPNPLFAEHRITVEEIDQLLHDLASRIRWSSPAIRSRKTTITRNRSDLGQIYRRLTSTEAKWFTRLVLKSYAPLILDENVVYHLCDPVLPSILKIRQVFYSAVDVVQSGRGRLLPSSGARSNLDQLLAKVKPELGIKVGRQHWVHGRSIKHCLEQGSGRMSVESKIDGEYCQIHIDLSKGPQCVQIFSKSGKDSTEDREGLHSIIKDSLRIGKPGRGFSNACILEGELAVYSDFEQRILPFHKIRSHVTRRGRFLNTDQDSLPKAHEHLMIVYYDILLLDDESFLRVRHSERFKVLTNLIACQRGWAELVQREVIDFNHHLAASNLRRVFAKTIVNKHEGLVLKPDEPYFDFTRHTQPLGGRCIKLKKEYIGSFGEVGDFAVVGAGYDPTKAKNYNIGHLKWTHFYIGCLENKGEVKRWSAKPIFTVVNVVELNETQMRSVVQFGSALPVAPENNDKTELNLAPGIDKSPRMTIVFRNPLVFDMRCFSFEKGGNTGFWSMRFPVVSKVHFDRDFTDTCSFEELQELAVEAVKVPQGEDSQETLQWIARLEGADPRGIAVDAVSQQTSTTVPTPSPCRSTSCRLTPCSPQSQIQSKTTISGVALSATGRSNHEQPRNGPRDCLIPALPLITPPISSAPAEQLTQRDPRHQYRKQSSPSKESTLGNKRRLEDDRQPFNSLEDKENRRKTRKPMAEIDANASQRSTASLRMDSQTPKPLGIAQEYEVIDLTSEAEASFTTSVAKVDSLQTTRHLSQESEDIVVFPPTDNQNWDNVAIPSSTPQDPASLLTSSKASGLASPGNRGRTDCVLAGRKCQFANAVVLLAPHLTGPARRMVELFDTHGIKDGIMDIKGWLAGVRERHTSGQDREVEQETILLVDSLRHGNEVGNLLNDMMDARKDHPVNKHDPLRRCDWITVYDWRVLEHISIMEDESSPRKYYDGFKDPWKRWYCGFV